MTSVVGAGAVVAAAVATVLIGEWKQLRWMRYSAKPVASLAFVALAVVRFPGSGPFGAWLLLGLVLCAVGDVSLLGEGVAFRVGLTIFLLGHVAYVLAFLHLVPASEWPLLLAAPVVVASVLAARWLWPHVGVLRVAVAAYIAVITVMVWGGLSAGWSVGAWTVMGASVLFYASDLFVARQRFIRAEIWNRVAGLPMYYTAQLLFAYSVVGS